MKLGITDHLISGIEAGAIMVFVTNPMWLIKTRLQLQVNGDVQSKQYRGLRGV